MIDYEQLHQKYLKEYEEIADDIEQNIEKYRKSDAKIRIVDSNGMPINGVKVKVKQKTHDFKFGCNALVLGQLGEENKLYEEKILKLFNLVTTTICWSVYESPEGVFHFEDNGDEQYRRPPIDRVRKFAKENNLAFKGQPLVADSWWPEWSAKNPEELKSQYINYFKAINERYGKDFYLIDVVNEAYSAEKRTPEYPLFTPDLEYRNWAFEEVSKIFPDNIIFNYNEGSQVNAGKDADMFFNDVKKLIESGCGVDSCSFQYHVMTYKKNGGDGDFINHLRGLYNAPKDIYKVYHKFCELGIPMYISEITVPTKDVGLDVRLGEEIQADILECLYKLWFSIPNMNGIIYWNLKDGVAFGREGDCLGCLIDENFMEKPSYQRLYQLIQRDWKTCTEAETDSDGYVSFRGFNGDYEITITKDQNSALTQVMSVHKDAQNSTTYII